MAKLVEFQDTTMEIRPATGTCWEQICEREMFRLRAKSETPLAYFTMKKADDGTELTVLMIRFGDKETERREQDRVAEYDRKQMERVITRKVRRALARRKS